jgi:hypothetical protein
VQARDLRRRDPEQQLRAAHIDHQHPLARPERKPGHDFHLPASGHAPGLQPAQHPGDGKYHHHHERKRRGNLGQGRQADTLAHGGGCR